MKTSLSLFILCLFATTNTFGQKLEVGVQLNTGFSRFGGESTTGTTKVNYHPAYSQPNASTDNPYGSKLAATYGASAQVQHVFNNNIIMGAQLGFEVLRSKVEVNRVDEYENLSFRAYNADGSTKRRYDFINLQPFIGRRLGLGVIDMDLTVGTDLGLGLYGAERIEATYANGDKVSSRYELSTPKVDVRPRLGVTAHYKDFGLSLSYAHGLRNYRAGLTAPASEAYFRVLRVGLAYRLK